MNVNINGDCCVLETTIPLEDLEKIVERRPESLRIYDGDPPMLVFEVTAKKGKTGCLGDNGICFNSTVGDADTNACVTVTIPDGVEDKQAFVRKNFGRPLIQFRKIELSFSAALEEIRKEDDLLNSIIKTPGATPAPVVPQE